jgi:hypothetical protein
MSETGAGRPDAATERSLQPAAEPPEPPLTRQQRIDRRFDVVTAIMLGVVAVATAWSGYQAARWSGEQSASYAQAAARRVESTRDAIEGGQLRLYDLVLVNNWITASLQGNAALADSFERRFRPEFRPVFQAWLALDPFHNPDAPPGPLFMPQYQIGLAAQADRLEAEAARLFQEGQAANEQSDAYVLNTVFLATVLFLTAIAERFEWDLLRALILALALAMLLYGLYNLAIYPIT